MDGDRAKPYSEGVEACLAFEVRMQIRACREGTHGYARSWVYFRRHEDMHLLSKEGAQQLADAFSDQHAHIRKLFFDFNRFGLLPEAAIQPLVHALGGCTNIRTLGLRATNLDSLSTPGFKLLTDCIGRLSSLTHLNLRDNQLGLLPLDSVKELAGALTRLPIMTRLNLQTNRLGLLPKVGMQLLADAIGSHSRIREVLLSGNKLGEEHVHAVATIVGTPNLRVCELEFSDMQAVKALPDRGPRDWMHRSCRQSIIHKRHKKLEKAAKKGLAAVWRADAVIDLRQYLGALSVGMAQHLAEAIRCKGTVEKIRFGVPEDGGELNMLSTQVMRPLVEAICDNKNVIALELWSRVAELSEAQVQLLLQAVKNANVKQLTLGSNRQLGRQAALSEQAAVLLAEGIGGKPLEYLRFFDLHLGRLPEEPMQTLAQAIGTLTHMKRLELTAQSLGLLSVKAWQSLADAICNLPHLSTLSFNRNQLNLLPQKAMEHMARIICNRSSIKRLWLYDNYLGSLPLETMQVLCKSIRSNANLKELNLSSNALGSLSAAKLQPLADAIGTHPALKVLNLGNNFLGGMAPEAINLLAWAIEKNSRLENLMLYDNQLGMLTQETLIPLARTIYSHPTIMRLDLDWNWLGKKHGHATALMMGAPRLRECLVDEHDKECVSAMPGIGAFVNGAAAPWVPGVMLGPKLPGGEQFPTLYVSWPFDWYLLKDRMHSKRRQLRRQIAWFGLVARALASKLLDGTRPFRPRVLAHRLFWLLLCATATLLPRMFIAPLSPDDTALSTTAAITGAFTVGVLEQQCSHVPAALEHAYINAASGFMLVLILCGLMLFKEAFNKWLIGVAARLETEVEVSSSGRNASCMHGVTCCRTAKTRFARFIRIITPDTKREIYDEDEELEDTDMATTRVKEAEDGIHMRDQGFLFLVQVLCGCNALGAYFAVAPTGGVMCAAAHVGLAVFYKPLTCPLWYCLLVLVDSSGVRIRHTIMTDVLAWVVQLLFTVWALVCGFLSLALLVVFPMFGLLFYAPQWLFFKYKSSDISFVQRRMFGDSKIRWEKKLNDAARAELLAIAQLYERLRGYTIFAALVFGIRLWTFYATRDWQGTLSDAFNALGVSVPVWNWPTLVLMLRWPSELPLAEQLPLFVSAGFVTYEALLKVWRVATKKIGVSALDEVTLRRKGLLGGEMDSEASVVVPSGDLQREQQASGVSRKVVI
eukprot:g2771.t1